MTFRTLLVLVTPLVCAGQTGAASAASSVPAAPAAPAASGKAGAFSTVMGSSTTHRILSAGSHPPSTSFHNLVEAEDWLFADVTIYLASSAKMVWTNHLDAINVTRGRTWMWMVGKNAPPMTSLSQSNVGKPPEDRSMIKGIDKGVLGMTLMETRELNIPADEAFGSAGIPGIIPPSSGIKVEITAKKIKWKRRDEAARRLAESEAATRKLAADKAEKPAAPKVQAESPKQVPSSVPRQAQAESPKQVQAESPKQEAVEASPKEAEEEPEVETEIKKPNEM